MQTQNNYLAAGSGAKLCFFAVNSVGKVEKIIEIYNYLLNNAAGKSRDIANILLRPIRSRLSRGGIYGQ